MRLFVAIAVPESIRTTMTSLLDEFRFLCPNAKWIESRNWHVTLKFLGNTDASKLDSILKTLDTIRSEHRVSLRFAGLGFFPNARRPGVMWAGIEASPNVRAIVQQLDQGLAVLGFPPEEREFTPHLTLARLDRSTVPAKLIAAVEQNAAREFGSFTATRFQLFESKLKSSGAEYTTVQSFSFMSEA